jgi:6-phospho-beta-glucosidase
MTTRLVILGGSSPFTIALIDALAAVGASLPVDELTLHGRNEDRLRAVARYARARLPARVCTTTDLERALDGATVVLHQARYGGMEGRADDEAFAERFGIPADETLGPAALRCALRIAPALRWLGGVLRARCPDAWVINLVNPLSVSTDVLCQAGARCVGVCELPKVTAQEIARVLDVPCAALAWRYDGLNHRGFLHHITVDGRDHVPRLVARLGHVRLNGIEGRVIDELHAVPLKHFALLGQRAATRSGRAAFLSALGERVFGELEDSPFRTPASLGERDVRWYPEAVVPAIQAVMSDTPSRLVVDVPDARGIVAEVQADVSAAGVRPADGPVPGARVAAWLDVFARHERAVMDAVAHPTVEHVSAALAADPLLQRSDVTPLAEALRGSLRQEESSWTSTSR